jgi:hypothetical protein
MTALTWRKLIDVLGAIKPFKADQVKLDSRTEAPGRLPPRGVKIDAPQLHDPMIEY